MPHIILCDRYWRVSGDELPITAICAILGRLVALIIFSVLFHAVHEDVQHCHGGGGFSTYIIIAIVSFSISILIELSVAFAGLQGTMVEMSVRRKGLERALSAHYAFAIVQLFLAMWGMLLIKNSLSPCGSEIIQNSHVDTVLLTIVVIMQLIDVISQFCCCYLLRGKKVSLNNASLGLPSTHALTSKNHNHDHNDGLFHSEDFDDDDDDDYDIETQKQWEKRCSAICKCSRFFSCGIFGGSGIAQDIEAVAKVFTNFFQHDGFLDVVPSDVLAGILLVRLQQRRTTASYYSGKHNQNQIHNDSNGIDGSLSPTSASTRIDASGRYVKTNTSSPVTSPTNAAAVTTAIANTIDIDTDIEIGLSQSLMNPDDNTNTNSSSNGNSGNNSPVSPLPKRSRETIEAPRKILHYTNLDDIETIRYMTRMCKFAFAMYSHLLYLYDRPITGICRLCMTCVSGVDAMNGECCCQCSHSSSDGNDNNNNYSNNYSGSDKSKPRGENCCYLNDSAVASTIAEMGNAETVFTSYYNDAQMKPYGIFLDHDNETIVISIRGSLSLEDCITDVMCDPAEMTSCGNKWGFNGNGRWAHGGMLRSAEVIREDIEREGILKALLPPHADAASASDASAAFDSSKNENQNISGSYQTNSTSASASTSTSAPNNTRASKYAHYGLSVVGHSLGAGAAILLSLMLQNKYPMLRCCAYGTPGSLVDKMTADDSKTWLTSIILNNDIIARLGISTFNYLREQVLIAITRAKVNKTTIMRTLVEEVSIEDYLYTVGNEPESEFKNNVYKFLNYMRKKNESDGTLNELVLPGRIIHLSKSGRGQEKQETSSYLCTSIITNTYKCCCNSRKSYIPEETTNVAFREIILSPSMALDHFPDRYCDELDYLLENWNNKIKSNTVDCDMV